MRQGHLPLEHSKVLSVGYLTNADQEIPNLKVTHVLFCLVKITYLEKAETTVRLYVISQVMWV